MLPTNLVRVRMQRGRLYPQYLDATSDQQREIAEQVLNVFRGQDGISRGELEDELEELIGNHPGQILFQGLAKLLEDRCEFEVVSEHPPDEIRARVFETSAKLRAEGAFDRRAVLSHVGGALSLTESDVEKGLFADLRSEQKLVRFDDINVTRLIERYNVALAQSIIMRASGLSVIVRNESPARWRSLLRTIKFHRLICDVEHSGAGTTTLRLDGPMSLFSATQRYGVQLANFIPHILLCRDFELRADVRWGAQRRPATFVLATSDALSSHVPDHARHVPPELEMFVELFRKKSSDWDIAEETELLPLGRSWWAPDFRLIHRSTGRHVHLEVLGFWRRASAEKHLERLKQFAAAPFLLAVSDQLKIDDDEAAELPAAVHRYRSMPNVDAIIESANALLDGKSLFDGDADGHDRTSVANRRPSTRRTGRQRRSAVHPAPDSSDDVGKGRGRTNRGDSA